MLSRRYVAGMPGALSLVVATVFAANAWAQAPAEKPSKIAPSTKGPAASMRIAAKLPDLVVTSITTSGSPRAVSTAAGNVVEVPLTVVVKNQGPVPAGAFKVSTDFTKPGGGTFAVAFTVGGSVWYAQLTGLAAGASQTITGKLSFLSSVHGAVTVKATVDSCSGDEFMPAECRVKESNETNNQSSSISITLP